MPLVFGGPGMALPKTLAKSDKFAWSKFEQPIGWPEGRKPWMVFVKRRIKAECRVAFSLNTFFWPRKRKYFGCRAETRHQNKPR